MDLQSEIDKSIDLLKRDNSGRPSKAHRHLAYVMRKGDRAKIEEAIDMIRRAEFFAGLANLGIPEYAMRQSPYWDRIESRGEVPPDYLGNGE